MITTRYYFPELQYNYYISSVNISSQGGIILSYRGICLNAL